MCTKQGTGDFVQASTSVPLAFHVPDAPVSLRNNFQIGSAVPKIPNPIKNAVVLCDILSFAGTSEKPDDTCDGRLTSCLDTRPDCVFRDFSGYPATSSRNPSPDKRSFVHIAAALPLDS